MDQAAQQLEQLFEASVIENSGEEIRLTPEFERELHESTPNDSIYSQFTDILGENRGNALLDSFPDLSSLFVALQEFLTEVSNEELLSLLPIVHSFTIEQVAKDQGAPIGFLPVTGEQLEIHLSIYSRAIVYVWLEDCEPCDVIKNDFEEIFRERTPEVPLLAVYGPECKEILYEKYDVVGGPTVLFIVDGKVETRFQGAPFKSALLKEVEIISEL